MSKHGGEVSKWRYLLQAWALRGTEPTAPLHRQHRNPWHLMGPQDILVEWMNEQMLNKGNIMQVLKMTFTNTFNNMGNAYNII